MTGNGEHSPAWMCPKSVISVSLGCVDAFALTVRASSDTRRELGQMDTACSSPSAAARRVQCSRFLTQGTRHGISCGFDDPRGYSTQGLQQPHVTSPRGLGTSLCVPQAGLWLKAALGAARQGSSPGRLHQSLGQLITH